MNYFNDMSQLLGNIFYYGSMVLIFIAVVGSFYAGIFLLLKRMTKLVAANTERVATDKAFNELVKDFK